MKIASIRVHKKNLELTRPYTIAYKTVSSVESCFVEVEASNGMVGRGAANPSQQVVGTNVDDCIAALHEEALDRVIGQDLRAFRSLCEHIYELFPEHAGARAALDIALHDLWGQYLGIPVARFYGQQHDRLPTSITIGIKGVAETLEEAEEYFGRGFRYLKVKLGQSLEEDLERLVRLRERFADKVHLRVDANQGYTLEQTRHFHQATQSLNLELVEQPIPRAETEQMRQLAAPIREDIAADESLVDVNDAFHLVASPQACGIFNIKLMKCGGMYQALRIAEVARLADISLMWGCNDESIISITAALHAALSCAHTRFLDLDGSLDLAQDVVKGGFQLENGYLSLLDRPGLGLEPLS